MFESNENLILFGQNNKIICPCSSKKKNQNITKANSTEPTLTLVRATSPQPPSKTENNPNSKHKSLKVSSTSNLLHASTSKTQQKNQK